jgi:transitional endoplasmic reticulum ATPase
LHGNVRDLQPWTFDDGRTEWVDLRTFLERFLSRTRDMLVSYDISQGFRFASKEHETKFRTMVAARRQLSGLPGDLDLPTDPIEVVSSIEQLLVDGKRKSGIILDYSEMLLPQADPAFMQHDDKRNLVTFRRWTSSPAILATDNILVMITESVSGMAKSVVSSPQLVLLRVDYPDENARTAYVAANIKDTPATITTAAIAKVSAGLTLMQIRSIIQMARQSNRPVDFALINARKKIVLEQECMGLIEFIVPKHNLSHVGGMDEVKADLLRVSDDVKSGNRNRVPMGMIFVGPMGTGKTFVAEAFAAESGLTCLKLRNFRGGLVGDTERNLEKVLELVETLGYVVLVIDEADRALSTGDGDGGVDSRVIARLKEFLSDTGHRGRILVLMMTNRPDKLDIDLKRPGRFDMKIPFFFPESDEDRKSMLAAIVRKNGFTLDARVDLDPVAKATSGYSAAEIEAVMVAAAGFAAAEGTDVIEPEDLAKAAKDTVPSRDIRMLDFMEMQAVFETSTRRLLPHRFQSITTDEVIQRIDQLKLVLGSRLR